MNVQVYSENHISRNDTDEEIKYINNNSYDSIIYENESGNISEGYMNRFYHHIFSFPRLLELLRIYDDSSDLIEEIEKSESELIYTRESNAIFYEHRPILTHICFILSITILFLIISIILVDIQTIGLLITLLSIILLSFSSTVLYNKTDEYREKEIARRINDQPKDSSILVIIGSNHKEEVINRIESDNIDVLDDK